MLLPSRLLADCLAHIRRPDGSHNVPAAVAAFQWTVAHELAHAFLSHTVSPRSAVVGLMRAPGPNMLPQASCLLGGGSGKPCLPCACLQAERVMRLDILAPLGVSIVAKCARGAAALCDAAGCSLPPSWAPAALHLRSASWSKRRLWLFEYEADDVACALLARLRTPPELWAAGLEVGAAVRAAEGQPYLYAVLDAEARWERETLQDEGPGALAAHKSARAEAMGWPSYEAGMRQIKAAADSGDADRMHACLGSRQA